MHQGPVENAAKIAYDSDDFAENPMFTVKARI